MHDNQYSLDINIEKFKPIDKIIETMNILKLYAEKVDKYNLDMAEKGVFLLVKGSIKIYGLSSDKEIWTLRAPNVIGFNELLCGVRLLNMRRNHCEVWFVSESKMRHVLSENRFLWENISYILAAQSLALFHRHYQKSKTSNLAIVMSYLLEIEKMPDDIKLRTNVASYICERVDISKSSVMEYLKGMRDNGSITMQRGVLVSINTELK